MNRRWEYKTYTGVAQVLLTLSRTSFYKNTTKKVTAGSYINKTCQLNVNDALASFSSALSDQIMNAFFHDKSINKHNFLLFREQ